MQTSQAIVPARFVILSARAKDAAEIARLAAVLGYPSTAEAVRARLQNLASQPGHWVAVASREGPPSARSATLAPDAATALGGWVQVARCTTLEGGDYAEILGLVVDVRARRSGVGRQLVAAAEHWGREQGLARMTVRSNAARVESHAFYAALGYARAKTQHVYVKALSGAGSG